VTVDQLRDLPIDPASSPHQPAGPADPLADSTVDPGHSPAWARPALLALLLGTALLYLWGLGASGWANAFYSAAAQAGSTSWKAYFFGSSDAGNSITVDKTPASLWVMSLSVRLFGLNSWAILVPQALAGVASVGLLFATVRRWFGSVAGLIAGVVMALTPVAVLMFRFNNPDALLVLLLVAAAYTTTRAIERASTRWLMLTGALVGLGFLTKMLQAFLVLPAFATAYLLGAPASWGRRIRTVLLAGLALLVSAGWWVAVVELMPTSARPYIGGSQTNSVWELTFGYNGLGRLTGDEVGSVTGPGGGPAGAPGAAGGGPGSPWGQSGLLRLFDTDNGGQISWLLPAALIMLAVGLALSWRDARRRAAYLLWGWWLVVTAATFSLMAGIFHPYYSVALAPAVAALVGMGTTQLWQRRSTAATLMLSLAVAATTIWSWVLLGRVAGWLPWLAPLTLLVGLVAAAVIAVTRAPALSGAVPARAAALATPVALGLAAVAVLAGPLAYSTATATRSYRGALPLAGPAVAGQGGRGFGRPGGLTGPPAGVLPGGFPGPFGGPFGGPLGPNSPFAGPGGTAPNGQVLPPGAGGPGLGSPGGGGLGGLLDAGQPSAALVQALTEHAGSYTWVAAAIGSNVAAGLQLAARAPVMPIGGFNGSDPSPTLTEFHRYVHDGRIHYFVASNGFRPNGGSRSAGEIAAWVTQHFTPVSVGGVTLYDLTQPAS
jgi:4-amino-4-deoxy-L-arabinose transferase-like glycosyltransferase